MVLLLLMIMMMIIVVVVVVVTVTMTKTIMMKMRRVMMLEYSKTIIKRMILIKRWKFMEILPFHIHPSLVHHMVCSQVSFS